MIHGFINRLLHKAPFPDTSGQDRGLWVVLLLLLVTFSASAVPLAVGDSAVVSLITCSPGPEVYARFGHTAVRVCDPTNGVDIVFNYGIFDFSSKNFYVKFIKGETDYKLAAYDFRYFLPEYEERNSSVWEQRLNLTPAERQRLIEALMVNYRPENRVYRYNFVFDNCSTRPRDKVEESLDGRVVYGADSVRLTFREWVGRYVGTDTWLKLGIDLIFGDEADRQAARRESMFLPEVLMGELAGAEVVTPTADGELRRPLVAEERLLVTAVPETRKAPCVLLQPVAVSWGLLLLGVLLGAGQRVSARRGRTTVWRALRVTNGVFDTVLFTLAGLIGCIVFFLDHISLHPLVGDNANILWLNPLLLYMAVGQWSARLRPSVRLVGAVCGVMALVILVLYAAGVHYFNAAFIPLALLVPVRIAGKIIDN